MEHTYEELKHKTVQQLREIAAELDHPAVQGATQMNKEHLIPAVCEALGIPADAGLWAIERPRVGFWIGLVALVVLAGVGAFLIPAYGAVGAAGALAAASGTAAVLQLAAFLKLSAAPDVVVSNSIEDAD